MAEQRPQGRDLKPGSPTAEYWCLSCVTDGLFGGREPSEIAGLQIANSRRETRTFKHQRHTQHLQQRFSKLHGGLSCLC